MKSLSIILPAYNAQNYLPAAIASIRAQKWPGTLELLVIDDGSEDDTAKLARENGATVLQQAHRGAAAARNAGLRAATGDLLFFLDADDLLAPGALNALRAEMENAACQIVFGFAEDFVSPELSGTEKASCAPRSGAYGGVLPGCALIERAVFERVGIFQEELKSGETVEWQIRLRQSGIPISVLQMVTLHRRIHMTNTGRLSKKAEMCNYAAILRKKREAGTTGSGERK